MAGESRDGQVAVREGVDRPRRASGGVNRKAHLLFWTENPSFLAKKQTAPVPGSRRNRVLGEKNPAIDTTKERIIKPATDR
jgi:hypothetical protein